MKEVSFTVGARASARHRRFIALSAAVLLLGAATTAGSCQESDRDTSGTLAVALIPFIGYAPLYVADELKLCEKRGVSLRLVPSSDQAALDTAMAAGDADVGAYGNTSLVFANGAGVALRAVQTIDFSVGADAVVGRGVSSVEELSRRKVSVATDRADIAYFVLMAAAARQGLGPDDFNHVQMPNSQALPAFANGSVGAVGVAEPLLSQALRLSGSVLLASTKDDPGLVSDVFAGTADRLERKRTELAAFRQCWFDAVHAVREEPARSKEVIARRLGVRAEEVDTMVGSVVWPDEATGERYLRDGQLAETLTTASALYAELGLLRQNPPAPAEMISGAGR